MNNDALTLPATGQDVFNYLAKYTASDHQIRLIVVLETHLDHARLIEALRQLIARVPVLAYRFVEDEGAAGFFPGDPFPDQEICPLFNAGDLGLAISEFTMQEIDPLRGPFFQVGVFRGQENDTLCCKIDHSCSDAGGLKACVYLLAEIYSCLESGEDLPDKGNRSNREASGFLQAMGVTDPAAEWAKVGQPTQPSWGLPQLGNLNQRPTFTLRHIANPLCQAIKSKCGTHPATVNEALLTAYYRALLKLATTKSSQEAEIRVTVDLRRFIPEGEKLFAANVSGGFMTTIIPGEGESFKETLAKVLLASRTRPVAEATVPIASLFELIGQMEFT